VTGEEAAMSSIPKRGSVRTAAILVMCAASSLGSAARTSAQSPAAPLRPALEALDHLVLAVPDLDRGIAAIAERTGVVALPGGSHPGRGTRNALLSLGAGHYLEIVAPDPAQPESKQGEPAEMAKLGRPLLGGWAVASTGLAAELERSRARGLEVAGPFPGGRDRPDGKKLSWQTAFVSGPLATSLPFFIEWGADSPHPSTDAPLLGQLVGLIIVHPDPPAVRAALAKMGLDCQVEKGEAYALRARIATLRGTLDL
jgi:hypothetical protein